MIPSEPQWLWHEILRIVPDRLEKAVKHADLRHYKQYELQNVIVGRQMLTPLAGLIP